MRCKNLIVLALSLVIVSCSTESTPIYQLNVTVEPLEAGTVSPSSLQAEKGESIEITASANEHWIFNSWSGDHSGTSNPSSVTLNSDQEITALFIKKEYALSIIEHGGGSVLEEIVQTRSNEYIHGTIVELNAVADEGWLFSHWEGDIEGSENPVTIEVDGEKTVTAVFERKNYELFITVQGEGAVDEKVVNAKSNDYPYETIVELTANASVGWVFSHWEGDLTGGNSPVQLEIDSAKEITAVFVRDYFEFVIDVEGSGDFSTELLGGHQNDEGYEYESKLKILATSGEGWHFSRWKGDITNANNPDTVIVEQDLYVIAEFERNEYALTTAVEGEGSVNEHLLSGTQTESGYLYESEVELEAIPVTGWQFVEWQGDLSGSENPAYIQMNLDRSVTALFEPIEYAIEISFDGEGTVSEQLISGQTIGEGYMIGSVVELTVEASGDWKFVYWGGSLDGINNPIEVTVDGDIVATAHTHESPFAGGNGSEMYPYQIENIHELQELESYPQSHFIQTANIDATITEHWNNGYGFIPIGSDLVRFRGKYNGNGFTITGLTIDRPNSSSVGLFGFIEGGTIKNIKLEDVTIVGGSSTGGVVGLFYSSKIDNSKVSGSVKGTSNTGGLVGYVWISDFHNSLSSVSVYGTNNVGGIVGRLENGAIHNSYSNGPVMGGSDVGGLIGYSSGNGEIKHSYSTSQVQGDENIGSLIGANGLNIVESYFDIDVNEVIDGVGRGLSNGVSGLRTIEMQGSTAQKNMPDFDWLNVWMTTSGYPILKWQAGN